MRMLGAIPSGSLVILDRGFNGGQLLLGLRDRGSHFLVRMRKGMRGRTIARLGWGDRLLEVVIPGRLRRLVPGLPKRVLIRELTAQIGGRGYR